MVTGGDMALSVGIMAVTAAVVGFIGAYAAVKGAQMAGGIPLSGSASSTAIYGLDVPRQNRWL